MRIIRPLQADGVRSALTSLQFTRSVQVEFKATMVMVLNDFCSENEEECGTQSVDTNRLVLSVTDTVPPVANVTPSHCIPNITLYQQEVAHEQCLVPRLLCSRFTASLML